jgi:hypothetical protein
MGREVGRLEGTLGRMKGAARRLRVLLHRDPAGGVAPAIRQPAGEALILRDDAGAYFAVPVDVLPSVVVSPEAAASLRRGLPGDAPRFPIQSSRFGPLEFLGANGRSLVLRDPEGGFFAIPLDVLRAARVPPEGTAELEEQLPPAGQPFPFDGAGFGALRCMGALQIRHVPDVQDAHGPFSAPSAEESPAAAPAAELAEARAAFLRNGWCTLSAEAFRDRFASVVREGEGLVRAADHEYEVASEDNLSIRMKRYATYGPVLSAMHGDAAVLGALRALTGSVVVPTKAAYYFYSGDDYISLHTDASHCPLAVLVRVVGDPPPLMICPELRGCAPETLLEVAARTGGHPRNGEPMRFPPAGAIVFRGCELPHHRPPGSANSGPIGVAQLCYRSVWSRTRPPRRMVADRPVPRAR